MNQNEQQNDIFKEQLITEDALNSLMEIGKWGRFLAIVNFVFLSLFLIGILLFFSFISNRLDNTGIDNNFPFAALPIMYFFVFVLYGVINYFFYKYCNNLRIGAREQSSMHLENAFRIQKTFFKIAAIFAIITMSFYAVAIIIGLFTASYY